MFKFTCTVGLMEALPRCIMGDVGSSVFRVSLQSILNVVCVFAVVINVCSPFAFIFHSWYCDSSFFLYETFQTEHELHTLFIAV